MDFFTDSNLTTTIIWGVLALICLVLELTSGGFYLMCFAFGCAASAICASFGLGFVGQIIVFAVSTTATLFFVRPIMVRMMKSRDKEDVRTNADAIIGRTAIVSEEIKAGGFGRVALDGDDWKATATTDIAKGEQVEIISRESIILTVNKLNNN